MRFLSVLLLLFFTYSATSWSYDDVAEFKQNKIVHKGFVPFFYDSKTGKVYVEIKQFDQPFLFQSSLPHGLGSNDIGLDRGQLGATRLVKFERVGEKVFLRQLNTRYRAVSQNAMEQQSIDEAFASSIIWGFKVVAADGESVVIDYTPFLLSDIHGISNRLKQRQQGNFKIDDTRSGFYSTRSRAFVDNTELEATVTFTGSEAGNYLRDVAPDSEAFTVNLHHSLIRLPNNDYQSRVFHPKSGFWSIEHADYAQPIESDLIQRVIPRHRLKKKQPNAAVSEPVKPIVYYLDPGVPEPIRSALIEGAMWWDEAFRAIGFKNAFQVKMLPPDADPMDIRYNVIQWVHRATRGWSYGSSVIDPRSGEIIKGLVTLGSLRVRQDYLIALGLSSPFSAEQTSSVEEMKAMALARIRQLSAHEVGHTLGIAHNFAASSYGRESVMDYPHPLVTLKDNKIDFSQAYDTGLGAWDKWVVAYGYGDYRGQDESAVLAQLLSNAAQNNLMFISDPDARPQGGSHASAHLWDNGQDPVAEFNRVLAVRKFALNNLGLDTLPPDTPLSELQSYLVPIYNFHRYQLEAMVKLIAGEHYSYEVKSAAVSGVKPVSAKLQHQAINAVLASLAVDNLTIPLSVQRLIPPPAYGYEKTREHYNGKMGLSFDPISAAEASANFSLSLLLNSGRLSRLSLQHAQNPQIPSVAQLIERLLQGSVKHNALTGEALLIQQRVNQVVVDSLIQRLVDNSVVPEVKAELYLQFSALDKWLKQATAGTKLATNPLAGQYRLIISQLEAALREGKTLQLLTPTPLPPGSPIGQ